MGNTGGMVRGRFIIAHPKRVRRIKIEDAVVFHINLGYPVVGGRQKKVVVKTDLAWTGFQVVIPVRSVWPAEAQVNPPLRGQDTPTRVGFTWASATCRI